MNTETKPKAPHLMSKDLHVAEHARAIHMAKGPSLPMAQAVAAMKDPAFWANVSTRMRPNDRIEAMPEDGSYFVEFVVRATGPNFSRVEVMREHSFVSAETLLAKVQGYKVGWGGPAHKWRVTRENDGEVMEKGFDTPEQASEWLAGKKDALAA